MKGSPICETILDKFLNKWLSAIKITSHKLQILRTGILLPTGHQSLMATPKPAIMPSVLILGHDTSIKNGLALAIWYHTPGTTMSRLWAVMILNCAAYTWHWRIDVIFVWMKQKSMSSFMVFMLIYLYMFNAFAVHLCVNFGPNLNWNRL